MESSAITRYIPQKSKKRVFPGTSSSCMDPDVIEVSPQQANRTPKSKSDALLSKEGIFHEIIDVDMDEDHYDVMLLDRKVEMNKKGKDPIASAVKLDLVDGDSSKKIESNKRGKDAITLVSPTPSSALQVDPKDGAHSLKKSFGPGLGNFFDLDGPGSDVYNDNDYMDAFTDDFIFEDDYLVSQSYFDNMDLPPGVEAPIPWLPDAFQIKKNMTSAATSSVHSADPTLVKKPLQSGDGMLTHLESASQQQNAGLPSFWPPAKGTKKPSIWSHNTYDQLANSQGPGTGPSIWSHNHISGSSGFTLLPIGTGYPSGVDTSNSEWPSPETAMKEYLEMKTAYSGFVGTPEIHVFSTEDMSVDQNYGNSQESLSVDGGSSAILELDNEDLLKKYESFKKFDTVEDHSDHYYSSKRSATRQPPKNWAKKIQEEWRILEKDLPDTIYVRVYESRMDLLRAVIIGAEGTPYHDGLFFFDVCFPSSYPNVPPLVYYHSGGLRINPNLYNCGKVCLSLLNTWTGGQQERWIPGLSTMLQVLVSIQGLILNAKPYFNEPGYASTNGSPHGENSSMRYNENTLMLSLKTMVYTMKRPPKNFEELVIGHFRNRMRDILMACKAYIEGVQVGSLVKGGVQDVDEGGDKSCSPKFKNDVASFIKTIVAAFKHIGANDAEEFLPLSEKITPLPPPPPPAHFPSFAKALSSYNNYHHY